MPFSTTWRSILSPKHLRGQTKEFPVGTECLKNSKEELNKVNFQSGYSAKTILLSKTVFLNAFYIELMKL